MHWYECHRDEKVDNSFFKTFQTTFKTNDWEEVTCWFYDANTYSSNWIFYFIWDKKIIIDMTDSLYNKSRYSFNYIDLYMDLSNRLQKKKDEKEFYKLLEETHIIWNPNPEFAKLFSQLNEIEETRKKLLDMIKNLNS